MECWKYTVGSFISIIYWRSVNSLHPNISMLFLYTVLLSFPNVQIRRICLTVKSVFSWGSFRLCSWPWCLIQGWYGKGKLDVCHSLKEVRELRVKLSVFIPRGVFLWEVQCWGIIKWDFSHLCQLCIFISIFFQSEPVHLKCDWGIPFQAWCSFFSWSGHWYGKVYQMG